MKKVLVNLTSILFLLFLDILIYKTFPYFIRANVWLIYIIFTALFLNHITSTITGFVLGIIADFLHLKFFGLQTISLSTLGYLSGWLNKRINEKFIKVQIIVLFLSSLAYFIIYFLLSRFLNLEKGNFTYFILSPIVNSIFGLFLIQIFVWYYKKWKLI